MVRFPTKYLWATVEFDNWVKNQQKELRESGFKVSTAMVTHKLLNDVLIPNNVKLVNRFPKMQMIKKKR